jgi:hypothetical protein
MCAKGRNSQLEISEFSWDEESWKKAQILNREEEMAIRKLKETDMISRLAQYGSSCCQLGSNVSIINCFDPQL